jgi:magnesium-transporting ATPase (P-type)
VRIHNLAINDLTASLHTSIKGLSSTEAKRRLIEFGPNAIEEEKGKPLYLKFLRGFTHFFAVILWCGAAIAFFAEWKAPGGGMGLLGCAILGVIFINAVFSFWQEYKAEQAIAALRKLIPHTVKVFRDSVLTTVPAGDIVPGDLIFLEEGDDVPGDGRLIEAFGLRVNNATMTGESTPQSRGASDSTAEEVMHSANVVLAGTSVFTGHGKALVFATGMRSEFGRIARMTQAAEEDVSPLQHEIVRLSRVIAILAIGVGLLFLFVGKALGISFWANVILALGIIVALVPEGLLPALLLPWRLLLNAWPSVML